MKRTGFRLYEVDRAPYVGPAAALLPDETLYSWITRIAQAMGLADMSSVREFLFGGAKARFYPDLATGFGAFVKRSGQTRLNVHDIALATTTFGYFANFLRGKVSRSFLNRISEVGTYPHNATGLAHGTFEVKVLRFCRQCHQQMDEIAGVRWWRRSHQLPTTLRCPDHHCSLQESRVDYAAMRNGLLPPDVGACPADAVCLGDTGNAILDEILTSMARFGQIYLDLHATYGPRRWASFYRKALSDRKMSQYSGQALVQEIDSEIRIPVHQLHRRGLVPFVKPDDTDWIGRVVLGEVLASPMEHILFQACLDVLWGGPLEARSWMLNPETAKKLMETRDILLSIRS